MRFLALILACALAVSHPAAADGLFDAKEILRVEPDRTITLTGPVGENAMEAAVHLLDLAAKSTDDIYMVINSPGGNVLPGMQLVQAMNIAKSRGIEIRCVVPNLAASMAFIIFANCTDRYAFNASLLLWHPMRVGTDRGMTEEDARAAAEYMHQLSKPLLRLQWRALGISWKLFMKHYKLETMWSAEALHEVAPHFLTLIEDVEGVPNIFTP